jgi:hypothetical protein
VVSMKAIKKIFVSTGSFRINEKLCMLIYKGCGALLELKTGGKILLMPEYFENMYIYN